MSLRTMLKGWLLDQGTLHGLKQRVPPGLKLRLRRWISGETLQGLDLARLGPMRVVKTVEELDAILAELDAPGISDDQRRAMYATFRMEYEKNLPPEPFSEAYRARQFALYERLAGKRYTPANEVSEFDVGDAMRRPFPFATGSATTVGNHLMAIGHLFKQLGAPPGGRVLEFGMGWANTTEFLARTGFQVVSVDIEPRFVRLARDRIARIGLANCQVVEDDFFFAERVQGPFDAILFFESFHHCSDHLRLMAAFDRIVAANGTVLFAAEPITSWFPIPWGLRMDGESLGAIRRNGWMELGFQESYFRAAMARFGWSVARHVCADTPWGVVYAAKRAHNSPAPRTGA